MVRCLIWACVCVTWFFGRDSQAKDPVKLALLVGCTQYPHNLGLRELHGPQNDVAIWAKTLTDANGFNFANDDVIQLSGWPTDEQRRPTFANIVRGFERLVERAEPDSRVVILLSGHGVQVPIPASQADPLDPRNPEPDGLDEVFLAADVENWTEEAGLKNSILDDQIGHWLAQLHDKGAHVLVVFDCCHAGTMTRGGSDVREISRVANPAVFGIPASASESAAKRAADATANARRKGHLVPVDAIVKESKPFARGSLVAFYAAQSFEEAPELPCPTGSAAVQENFYGLLSWTLVETLRGRQAVLSYRELERLVATRIRATRGIRPPSPFAEGDVNREVLGMAIWPNQPPILLHKMKPNQFELDAGALHGITTGSVLAIHPPADDEQPHTTILGHVKVTSVLPATSRVTFVHEVARQGGLEWEAGPAGAGEGIPEACHCEIVVRDYGDMRLSIFAAGPTAQAAVNALPDDVRQRMRVVAREEEADWVLAIVTPDAARDQFQQRDLTTDEFFLLQGQGRAQALAKTSGIDGYHADSSPGLARKVFGRYLPDDANRAVVNGLARDLPKIFKWSNLWSIAGGVNATDGGQTHGLILEVLDGSAGQGQAGTPLPGKVLRDGQEVLFRLRHDGQLPLWVTAFYLDANLGIQTLLHGAIKPGQTLKLAQASMTTENGSYGLEGIVVLALPQAAMAVQPDFSLLEQEPLKVAEVRTRGSRPVGGSPFDRLLNEAAFRSGARGINPHVPTTPAILAQSWILLP